MGEILVRIVAGRVIGAKLYQCHIFHHRPHKLSITSAGVFWATCRGFFRKFHALQRTLLANSCYLASGNTTYDGCNQLSWKLQRGIFLPLQLLSVGASPCCN